MNAPLSEILPWASDLGWALLHFVWQGAVIAAVYAMLRMLLPARCSGLRYGLGLAALAASLLCIPLTLYWLGSDATAIPALLNNVTSTPDEGGAVAAKSLAGLMPWLVLIWLTGVGLMTGRALAQWRLLDRLATRTAVRHFELDRIMASVMARFSGMREIVALLSPHLDTPTLIGWVRPVIVLPSALLLRFPRHQLELILIHELNHLRRYDHLVNLAQVVIETLLFYHPAVHWISRQIRHEREICCDEKVVAMCTDQGGAYAIALAALEDFRQLSPRLSLAASGGSLLDRIRRIVDSPAANDGVKPRLRLMWPPALAGVLMGALLLMQLAGLLPAAGIAPEVETGHALDMELDVPGLRLSTLIFDSSHVSWPEPQFRPVPPISRSSDNVAATALTDVQPSEHAETLQIVAQPPAERVAVAVNSLSLAMPTLDLKRVEHVSETSVFSAATIASKGPLAASGPAKERPVRRLVHRVAPVYPGASRTRSRGRIELEFSVSASGAVRNIKMISVDTSRTLMYAAKRAARQWRFEPSNDKELLAERIRLEFVFAGIELDESSTAEADVPNCLRITGSRLCSPSLTSPEVQIQVIPHVALTPLRQKGATAGL